jgi:hypothetical protein
VGPTQLLTESVQRGCGAHPAPFLIRYLPHFPRGVKRPGVNLITDVCLRPVWKFTSTSSYVLCRGSVHIYSLRLHKKSETILRVWCFRSHTPDNLTSSYCTDSPRQCKCPFCPVPEHAALAAGLSYRSPASTGNSELLFRLTVQLNVSYRGVSKCSKCLEDAGFTSRNASSVQRHDKMDVLCNRVIEQVNKICLRLDFDPTAGPCASYFIIYTG